MNVLFKAAFQGRLPATVIALLEIFGKGYIFFPGDRMFGFF
jgi:hypothetical protein